MVLLIGHAMHIKNCEFEVLFSFETNSLHEDRMIEKHMFEFLQNQQHWGETRVWMNVENEIMTVTDDC